MLSALVNVCPSASDVSSEPSARFLKIREAIAAFPAGTPDENVQVAVVVLERDTVPVTPSYMQVTSWPVVGKLEPEKLIESPPFIATELRVGDEAFSCFNSQSLGVFQLTHEYWLASTTILSSSLVEIVCAIV